MTLGAQELKAKIEASNFADATENDFVFLINQYSDDFVSEGEVVSGRTLPPLLLNICLERFYYAYRPNFLAGNYDFANNVFGTNVRDLSAQEFAERFLRNDAACAISAFTTLYFSKVLNEPLFSSYMDCYRDIVNPLRRIERGMFSLVRDHSNDNSLDNQEIQILRTYIEEQATREELAEFSRLRARQILRRQFAQGLIPKWGDPNLPSGLKVLNAPLFLKAVFGSLAIAGKIDKMAVREFDKELMADVEQYISRRSKRNLDMGSAEGLQFLTIRDPRPGPKAP